MQKTLMTKVAYLATIVALSFGATNVLAQHCPPIVESYLQSVSIERSEGDIAFEIDYRKTGGQQKESYQTYILAYSQSDSNRIAALTPQEAIESKLATVVHTQLSKRQQNGYYNIRWKLNTQSFVASMLKDSRLDKQQIDDYGGWKSFKDRIRIAVFVPFLDDEKYSVVEGLPENKHECNYLGDSALLFETLSHRLSVHFGVVQALRIPEDQYVLQINGHRPSAKARADAK